MEKESISMKSYEALFIIDPSKEANLKEVTDNIAAAITKNNGRIDKEESWGKQRIAFPIKKNNEGIYYRMHFFAAPSQIAELNNMYKLNQNILRVMITAK